MSFSAVLRDLGSLLGFWHSCDERPLSFLMFVRVDETQAQAIVVNPSEQTDMQPVTSYGYSVTGTALSRIMKHLILKEYNTDGIGLKKVTTADVPR